MTSLLVRTLCWLGLLATFALAQDLIPLYPSTPPGSTPEPNQEKDFFSKDFNEEVVTNVSQPSLMVFKPAAELKNGTAIVICPGGAFMALSIKNEGTDVARYMAAKGVTAFVLKYRLAHMGENVFQEFSAVMSDPQKFREMAKKVGPLAVADGLAAVAYVRKHSSELAISPDRVGIIGFSAGGAIATAVAFNYSPEGHPAFVAPIYAGGASFGNATVPRDAPPMFIAAASDDQLGLASASVALYQKWIEAHKSAELHLYAKGGHSFGMSKQNLPVDHWIDRFCDWLEAQGFLKK